jgi:RimJ/RimL family protein N-acetyltransferase
MPVLIRRIQPDEGLALAQLRLAALGDSPSAFGSTYEAEAAYSDEEWSNRALQGATSDDSATFLALDNNVLVGFVSVYRPERERNWMELVSMWTAPVARRRGVGRALVSAVLDWAAAIGATRVELWVTRGNHAAFALYESEGFRLTGERQPLPSEPRIDELRMMRTLPGL